MNMTTMPDWLYRRVPVWIMAPFFIYGAIWFFFSLMSFLSGSGFGIAFIFGASWPLWVFGGFFMPNW